MPPLKSRSSPDDPEQLKRFKEMAREVGAEAGGDPERFDRILEKVAHTAREHPANSDRRAREVGAGEHPERLDQVLGKVVRSSKPRLRQDRNGRGASRNRNRSR